MSEPEKKPEEAGKPGLKPLDAMGLYEEVKFTDLSGHVRMMTPIKTFNGEYSGWERDADRPVRFFSTVNINIGPMPVPVEFEITAKTLEEAIANYAEQGLAAAQKRLKEIEAMRGNPRLIVPPGHGAPH